MTEETLTAVGVFFRSLCRQKIAFKITIKERISEKRNEDPIRKRTRQ